MKNLVRDDKVIIVGKYSGLRSGPYIVLVVSASGNKITIAKPEFKTGKEVFNYQPTLGRYSNNYSGSLYKV